MGSESPILDYIFLHSREVKWGGVKVTQLSLTEEVFDPHVNDVEDPRGEHVVMPEQVGIDCQVRFDVEEAIINLPDQKAGGREEYCQDVNAMIHMVLELVDRVWQIDFLLHEATDVIAIDAASAV
mgnify:CR=1 FL=1